MRKRTIQCLAILLAVMLAGCRGNVPQDTTNPVLSDVPTETANPVETTTETVPGVEDSIFDGDVPAVEAPAETEAPEKNTEAGSGATIPPDAPEHDGLQDPDSPEAPDLPESTKPSETQPDMGAEEKSDYEKFQAMTPAEQQAYMESFESIEAFFDWYEKAKAEYEAAHPPIDVGNGSIDLEDILGGNN